jgi:hypothetical protein
MRRFHDATGRAWEAVVGRESWGAFFAIFSTVAAGTDIRQAPLRAESPAEAERELDELDDVALQGLLERSTIKSLG